MISFNFLENLIHTLINRCQNVSTMGLNMLSNTINIKLNDAFPNCFYNSIKCQILPNRGRNVLLFSLSLPKDRIIIIRSWIVQTDDLIDQVLLWMNDHRKSLPLYLKIFIFFSGFRINSQGLLDLSFRIFEFTKMILCAWLSPKNKHFIIFRRIWP